jgi:TonB-dependent heme/hemoglobin receptor
MVSRIGYLFGRPRKQALRALGAALLSVCASHAFAQNAPITLDTIDIIGLIQSQNRGFQGTPDWVYETPGGVNVLTREQLEQRAPRNTSDLFRDMSGVYTATNRQIPGLTINIRGLQEQGRVNVNIDGARQNYQQAGHNAANFVYFDPELIGGVTVEKGPSSTLGGAGVIGGVVTLRTLEADDILLPGKSQGLRSRITFGDNAFRYTTSHAAAYKKENYEFVIAGSRKEGGDYKPGSNGTLTYVSPTGAPAVNFTDQDNWSGLIKFIARPAADQTVKLSYVALDNRFGAGTGLFIDFNNVFTQTAVADYSWKPTDSQWIDFSAKLWWSGTNNHQFRPPRVGAGYGFFDLKYGLDTVGGSVANTSRFALPMFNVTWTYGFEYFVDMTRTGSITDTTAPNANLWFTGPNPAGRRDVASGFTEMRFKHADWLELIVGGRYDFYALAGSGIQFVPEPPNFTNDPEAFSVNKSEGHFSPKLTLAVTPQTGVQIYGTYAQGARPPQIMETLQHGRHVGNGVLFGPNPNLRPEKSKTFELGTNFKRDNVWKQGDAFRAKVSAYYTTIEDYIALGEGRFRGVGNVPPPGTPDDLQTAFIHVNLIGPTTKMAGLDLEASYDASDYFLGASYSHLNADFNGIYDPFFLGPPYTPVAPGTVARWQRSIGLISVPAKHKITFDGGLRFYENKLTLGARAMYVAPTYPFATSPILPNYIQSSYDIYSLYASYILNENLIVRLNVDNLFDKAYVDTLGADGYPAPGRTITVSLQGKF